MNFSVLSIFHLNAAVTYRNVVDKRANVSTEVFCCRNIILVWCFVDLWPGTLAAMAVMITNHLLLFHSQPDSMP